MFESEFSLPYYYTMSVHADLEIKGPSSQGSKGLVTFVTKGGWVVFRV